MVKIFSVLVVPVAGFQEASEEVHARLLSSVCSLNTVGHPRSLDCTTCFLRHVVLLPVAAVYRSRLDNQDRCGLCWGQVCEFLIKPRLRLPLDRRPLLLPSLATVAHPYPPLSCPTPDFPPRNQADFPPRNSADLGGIQGIRRAVRVVFPLPLLPICAFTCLLNFPKVVSALCWKYLESGQRSEL